MPEVISLASFDFDSTRLEKTLGDLQVRMVALQKEQKAVSSSMKENQALFNVGAKTVEDYNKTNQQLFDTQKDLQRQQAVVNKEYRTAATLQQQLIDSDNKRISSTQALNNALNAQIKTISDARKNNSDLLKIRNEIDASTVEGAEQIKLINDQLNKNNQFIKDNASAYEQQKINIGNYKGAITEAFQELNIFNGGLSGFAQRAKEAGGAGALVSSSLKSVTSATIGLTKAMLGFLASPIGIILGVIAGAFLLIRNAMARSEESTNKLKTAIAPLVGLFKTILKVLEPIGEFLIDGIVAGFEAATNAIQTTIDLIGKGLSLIGFDEAGKSVQDFAKSMGDAGNQAKELAIAEQELEKSQRKARLTQLEYQKEAEQFRQIRDDETKTISERIKANEELGKVLERQLQEELAIAKQALLVSNLRIQAEGQTTELLDAQADALTNIADIEERITGQRSEQLVNQNSLRKEAHEKYMAQLDAQINKQKEAIELFIAQQGDRARTLQEQLDLDTKIADKQKAVLDSELKAKKISYEKYQTEVLKLNTDLANKQEEIIVESAKRELDEFIKLNQSKLKEGQVFTDEVLQQELAREWLIKEQRDAFQLEQYNQGLINETEYQDSLLATKEEYLLKEKELNDTFAEQEKAQRELNQAIEFENQLLTLEENSWTEFERKQLVADQQQKLEQQRLDEQLAAQLITQENYELASNNLEAQAAKFSEKIEAEKSQYKLNVASQTFGNLATIVGKETAIGKAFSIAQTTIDTYQSAVAAYKALAGIPVYGPVLGGIASGAAVASGLSTVRKIVATPIPSASAAAGGAGMQAPRIQGFANAGYTGDGGKYEPAGIVHKGEFVISKEKTNELGLNFLNALQYGNSFATGGFVGTLPSNQQSVQSLITQGFDASLISDAVREGAREGSLAGSYEGSSKGSQDGIVDLTTNRMIQNQATF